MSNNSNIQNQENVFSLFPKYELKQAESIVTKRDKSNIKDTFETENNDKSSKKKLLFGSTIASSILTAGILAMLLTKGFHGSSIKSISSELSKEIHEAGTASTRTTLYYAKKGSDKTLNFLQATSNYTAIKDTLFDKLFNTNQYTAKFAQKAREFAKSVVDNSLGSQYDRVGVKINDMASLLQKYSVQNLLKLDESKLQTQITIKDKTKTLKEWIDILSKQSSIMEQSFNDAFSLGARKARSDERNILLSDTGDKISEIFFKEGGLFKPSNYKTYITEEITADAQRKLKADIINARKKISNNILNIHNTVKIRLSDLRLSIKPNDMENIEILTLLKKKLAAFKECSGVFEAQERKAISKEMTDCLDKVKAQIAKSEIYSPNEKSELMKSTDKIKHSILSANENSKGALEVIMTILKGLNSSSMQGKKIISDGEFKRFEKLSKNISTDLQKATNKEIGEYFLKQAEMAVGSAATDVFSVLMPFGVGAYAISKCDDNDERISTMLKTCIPLVGTFATFVYGTIKMLSGAKNIIFATVSGLGLNKLGSYLDNLYQKYNSSGSVVQVAVGEYKDIRSDFDVQKKNKK